MHTSNTHVKGCRLNQGVAISCSSDWQKKKAKLQDNSDNNTLFGREINFIFSGGLLDGSY